MSDWHIHTLQRQLRDAEDAVALLRRAIAESLDHVRFDDHSLQWVIEHDAVRELRRALERTEVEND